MVDQIYPTELKLNKANSSDTEAQLLDLDLSITNGHACECIPAIMSSSKSYGAYETVAVPNDSHSTTVAKASLVYGLTTVMS